MKLTGLHFLLTYRCTFECDHCFVWGSPWQEGTMTLGDIREFLSQAKRIGTIQSIYFEGGEPFLYYGTLLRGVIEAAQMGFQVGIVSNAYWATSEEDALECLKPFQGYLQDLSVSSDLFHYNEMVSRQAKNANMAAEKLGISTGVISIARPEKIDVACEIGQIPEGESGVMYRGRAAEKLASQARKQPWEVFTQCPHEDLREPGRVHLDPYGNLHICQGIIVGNLFKTPLADICKAYNTDNHPITGPLIEAGPAGLVQRYQLPHAEGYADACHLCYQSRLALQARFPEILSPGQMYGQVSG